MNFPSLELVTKITDTGKGIEQDRIQYMFVLFGELKKKQELRKVKDISKIVIMQQKACDEMYKDSVLSNYSHEQLTPLNSFLNNSKMLL